MFDEFFGLPLHPFIVHATVVLLPAIAMLAITFVALSAWRWLTRWPLALAAVVTPILTYVTLAAGKALKDDLGIDSPLIDTHQQRAEMLLIYSFVFAALALAAVFTMGGPSLLASGAGSKAGLAKPVQIGVGALLVVASVLLIVQVVLTGDAGSRSVWSGV